MNSVVSRYGHGFDSAIGFSFCIFLLGSRVRFGNRIIFFVFSYSIFYILLSGAPCYCDVMMSTICDGSRMMHLLLNLLLYFLSFFSQQLSSFLLFDS